MSLIVWHSPNDARWTLDEIQWDTEWWNSNYTYHTSGTVLDMEFGTYKIMFYPVSGYVTPEPINVTLSPENETPMYDVEYLQQPKWYGDIGLFAGGKLVTSDDYIEHIYITITGVANNEFGLLTIPRHGLGSASNGSTIVFAGGTDHDDVLYKIMDSTVVSIFGNECNYFGDLTTERYGLAGCSDGVTGLFVGGEVSYQNNLDIVEKITIATANNAEFFSALLQPRSFLTACSNYIHAVFAGGEWPETTLIDYIRIFTITSIHYPDDHTVYFSGHLTVSRTALASCSNETYGVFVGGSNNMIAVRTMDYLNLYNLGMATFFGELNYSALGLAGCSNWARGVFAGGAATSLSFFYRNMSYIAIDAPSIAVTFGDLIRERFYLTSDSGN